MTRARAISEGRHEDPWIPEIKKGKRSWEKYNKQKPPKNSGGCLVFIIIFVSLLLKSYDLLAF